ncbi:MAG: tRNA pseudouridine32 synthase/23S rRNA pseudouridine746 synthase [Zhongshania sp.]|jgi:tRNA pseudouridine32 synthase/23S rRNA pseudouridine746 synthase
MIQIVDTFIAPPCREKIDILYRDDDIVLINKPSGLLSLSGKNPLNQDSVHYRMTKEFPDITLAHRLDFGTSGIMLMALNKEINAALTRQFQARRMRKTYIAILDGLLVEDGGIIDFAIAKAPELFPRQKICSLAGKAARSHYRVTERFNEPARSRVEFSPETGRTHQLRIHSREIGHPILGCDLYGSPRTLAMAKRLQLHAETLEFEHPRSGETITGQSPSPF